MRKFLLIFIFSVFASSVLATGTWQSCNGVGPIGSAASVCQDLVKNAGESYEFSHTESQDESTVACYAKYKGGSGSPDLVGSACKTTAEEIAEESVPTEFPVSDAPTQSEPEDPEVDSKKPERTQEEIANRSRVASLIQKARAQGDPGVAQLISKLEKNGVKVKDTNHYVGNPAREVDIETANGIIIQVKKLSSAQKIISQVQDTQIATGQRTVAFVVEQHRKANSIVQQAGKHVQITNKFDTLLTWL